MHHGRKLRRRRDTEAAAHRSPDPHRHRHTPDPISWVNKSSRGRVRTETQPTTTEFTPQAPCHLHTPQQHTFEDWLPFGAGKVSLARYNAAAGEREANATRDVNTLLGCLFCLLARACVSASRSSKCAPQGTHIQSVECRRCALNACAHVYHR